MYAKFNSVRKTQDNHGAADVNGELPAAAAVGDGGGGDPAKGCAGEAAGSKAASPPRQTRYRTLLVSGLTEQSGSGGSDASSAEVPRRESRREWLCS